MQVSEPVLFRLDNITADDLMEAIISGGSFVCADEETLRFFWLLSDYLIEQKGFMEKKLVELEDKLAEKHTNEFEAHSRAVSSGR